MAVAKLRISHAKLFRFNLIQHPDTKSHTKNTRTAHKERARHKKSHKERKNRKSKENEAVRDLENDAWLMLDDVCLHCSNPPKQITDPR